MKDEIFFTFFTDAHFSARPPGRRVGDYQASLMNKLKFIREWTNTKGGSCLFGGDLLHIKTPGSFCNTKSLLRELIEELSSFKDGKLYGVVGNHDVQYDRLDTLKDQPLGVLEAAGVFEILNTNRFHLGNIDVEVVGFHTGEELDVLQKILDTPKRDEGITYRIGVAHAMARPGGVQDHFGHPVIGYDLLEDIDFDVFLWGHDHSRVEPTEVGSCTHFHPGSMARAALSKEETDRPVTVLGLRFTEDGWGFREVEIPVEPLKIAFRTADKDISKIQDGTEVQGFLQEVKDSIGTIETQDPLRIIEELCGVDEKLKALVMELAEL